MNIQNLYKETSKSEKNGYTLPVLLLLGTILAVASLGLISTSIQRLTSARFKKFENMAMSASDSGISTIRALLNDSSSSLYYYFWLVDTCIINAKDYECPMNNSGVSIKKGYVPDPSKTYWIDPDWCDGIDGCIGRQKAPRCTYTEKIDWQEPRLNIGRLIDSKGEEVGNALSFGTKAKVKQIFSLRSSDYIGDEESGYNSILIEGSVIREDNQAESSKVKASNSKVRANIQVEKIVPTSGFGFIAAGENIRDENSLFLGNLSVVGDRIGSIIWRRNLPSITDNISCGQASFREAARANRSNLPNSYRGNGGIWIQPLMLPNSPIDNEPQTFEKNEIGPNPVVCLNSNNINSKFNRFCKFDKPTDSLRVYEMEGLFVKGDGGTLSITTSDDSPVTLLIKGDIDVSNGGKICHRHISSTAQCGSGKPANLTIQVLRSEPNKGLYTIPSTCNRDSNSLGGIQLADQPSNPNPSILISSTGKNNEKLSSFIYAPRSTFISSVDSYDTGIYEQDLIKTQIKYGNSWRYENNRMVMISRGGVYSLLEEGPCTWKNRGTRCLTPLPIYTSNNRPITYENTNDYISDPIFRGKTIIADGYGNGLFNSVTNMLLVYDRNTKQYELWGYGTYGSSRITLDDKNHGRSGRATSRCHKDYPYGTCHRIPLGPDPTKGPLAYTPRYFERAGSRGIKTPQGYRWIDHYHIGLKKKNTINKRSFTGSIWVKNACMDTKGTKEWEFSKSYIEGLTKRYGNSFNWGVPYYRGKQIELWDTLRDFNLQ